MNLNGLGLRGLSAQDPKAQPETDTPSPKQQTLMTLTTKHRQTPNPKPETLTP